MANTGSVGAVSPFGAESESHEVIVEVDPLTAFLTDVAPILVSALVVGAFLLYQFGRWYLARPRATVIDVEPTRAAKTVEPGVEPDEPAGEQLQRPWQTQ